MNLLEVAYCCYLLTPLESIFFIAFWSILHVVFIVLLIYSVLAADSIFCDSADIFTPKRRTFIASLRVLITVSACTFASSILPVFMASSIFFLSAFSYPFNFSAYLSICLALRRNSIATSIRSGFDFLPPIFQLIRYF